MMATDECHVIANKDCCHSCISCMRIFVRCCSSATLRVGCAQRQRALRL